MATAWPNNVPASPLLDGYNSQRMDSKLRTSVEAGLDKLRNRFRAAPNFITESFIFSNTEKDNFKTFHDDTLDGGAERFTREDPASGITVEYRFREEPSYDVVGYGKDGSGVGPLWRVDLELEIMPN